MGGIGGGFVIGVADKLAKLDADKSNPGCRSIDKADEQNARS